MIAELFILAVFPLLLAGAAGFDVASFTIPNAIPLALIGAFLIFAVAAHMTVSDAGFHLLGGAAGLLVGFALFAFGFVGGGDAKLFAATALWFGISDLLPYALLSAMLGGALAVIIYSARFLPLPAVLASQAWIARLHDVKSGVPYGVALAAGALLILPHADIFRAAIAH